MLLRVAQSASRFPLHIVAIYTSTGARAVPILYSVFGNFSFILPCILSLTYFSSSPYLISYFTSLPPPFCLPLLSSFLLFPHLFSLYMPPLSSTHLFLLHSSPLLFSLHHSSLLSLLSHLFAHSFQSLSASEQGSRALHTTTLSCSCPLTTVSTLKHQSRRK